MVGGAALEHEHPPRLRRHANHLLGAADGGDGVPANRAGPEQHVPVDTHENTGTVRPLHVNQGRSMGEPVRQRRERLHPGSGHVAP